MNTKDIKSLAKILDEYELTSIEWKDETHSIILKKGTARQTSSFKKPAGKDDKTDIRDMKDKNEANPFNDETEDFNDVVEVKSPFVGIFYSSVSIDSLPFVSIGSEVKKGDVICIVESMKLMNEITAEEDGKVIDICVKNGEIVEFGQVLYKLI